MASKGATLAVIREMIRGCWKDGRYIPEPSIQRFEIELGKIIAAQPCNSCGKPLGTNPRRILDKKQYHPECALTC